MNEPQGIGILLVEDSPTDALLIEEALSDILDFQHRLVHATSLSDALAQTRTTRFDIALLDLGLPDAQGLETFSLFHNQAPEVPVLVLTGLDDKSAGLQAIQHGAQDYLHKRETRPSELSRAIRYAIERHRVRRALEESEERFQLAVTGATAGLWDWNPQTDAMYLSTQYREIMGYQENALPGRMSAFIETVHPDDIERVAGCLAAHLARSAAYDVEYRVCVKSGGVRWIHSRGQALWGNTGKPYRMVGWIIDVTDRKLADESLRRSREELRHLSANIEHMREEEKKRIARELHDDLGQHLTALKLEVGRIDHRIGTGTKALRGGELHDIYALIDQLVVSVRRIAADLRPVMLDDLGLIPAIEWFVDDFSARYGVHVVRHIGASDVSFSHESATAVFRIVQEALTNIARHSGATEATVEIARDASDCTVSVSDNGRGCSRDERHAPDSFGLLGIRERANTLGGNLSIETAPGRGFALRVSLPLAAIESCE